MRSTLRRPAAFGSIFSRTPRKHHFTRTFFSKATASAHTVSAPTFRSRPPIHPCTYSSSTPPQLGDPGPNLTRPIMTTTLGSFIAGGIAACGAVTVTHSFETVKIRLQLQGELQAKRDTPRLYRGVLHGVGAIYRNEGLKGLLRGLSCAVGDASFFMFFPPGEALGF